MDFIARIRKVKDALHECAESIRRAEERKRHQNLPGNQPVEVRAVVSFDEKTVADATAQNKSQHATQESIKKATWYAFFAVAIYALITLGAWCQMIKQNHIASEAVRQSTDSFRMDERAWVEVEPITASPISPPDDKFSAGFSCSIYPKNVGKTVATNISVKAGPTLRTEEFSPEEMQSFQRMLQTAKHYSVNIGPEKTTQSVSDLFPSNPVPKVLAPNTISNAPFRVSCQATKDYATGGHAYTFVVGRIDYCDAFNIRHWKTFCFYVANARGDVWSCQEGNDEDRNAEVPAPETACAN